MDDLIQVPLNMPDVRLLSTQRTEQGPWLIRVESTLEGAQCRRCGREIRDLHGLDAVVRLRHVAQALCQDRSDTDSASPCQPPG
jgi:transposase